MTVVIVGLFEVLLLGTTGTYEEGQPWRYMSTLFSLLGVFAVVRSGFRNLAGPAILTIAAGGVSSSCSA